MRAEENGGGMRTPRLLYWLTAYYLGLSAALLGTFLVYPEVRQFLPVGGVESLIAEPTAGPLEAMRMAAPRAAGFAGSLAWLIVAIAGAMLAALPVSWTYMEVRARREYDQSLVETIVVLPMVVTGIIVIVHNSLALAFSLAGIAAGVRFRHSLKRPSDTLFILLAIGIGLAAGIGAVELAIVMSIAFNYVFLLLWIGDYGARKGAKRSLRERETEEEGDEAAAIPGSE